MQAFDLPDDKTGEFAYLGCGVSTVAVRAQRGRSPTSPSRVGFRRWHSRPQRCTWPLRVQVTTGHLPVKTHRAEHTCAVSVAKVIACCAAVYKHGMNATEVQSTSPFHAATAPVPMAEGGINRKFDEQVCVTVAMVTLVYSHPYV